MSFNFQILYQDADLIAIHKPSGFHVHPHENPDHRVPKNQICLYVLRNQINQYVYPIHRLDVGTSGVLLFAKNSTMAGQISKQFNNDSADIKGTLNKIYHCVVRGYVNDNGVIDLPLKSDSSDLMLAATTQYEKIKQIELPYAVGKRHSTARYSLVKVKPKTGRYHQIRRHFDHIFHPLLGDATHGDSYHNRFFREQLGIQGLCLRATQLEFYHPLQEKTILITADLQEPKWLKISDLFQWLY